MRETANFSFRKNDPFKNAYFDREIVMSGSANLSIYSMNYASELNLLVKNTNLVSDFVKIADWRKSVSTRIDELETLAITITNRLSSRIAPKTKIVINYLIINLLLC